MTIRHHLTDQLLMAYSAGQLPEAFSLVIATHVSLCDECRARLMAFDAVGGAVLENAPALDMALVLLGIPLVLGPSRRGVFVAVGLCVGMTVVFFLTVMGSHSLVTGDAFSPSIGAWMPLLVLAPLAAWRAQPMWQ